MYTITILPTRRLSCRPFTWLGLLGLLGLLGCATSKPAAPPADFRITLSRGGGFTGMTTGYHLQSDGTLTAWRRPLAKQEQIDWSYKHPTDLVRRWAEDLQGAVRGWESAETGNMTTRLEFAREDSVWTWTWAGTAPPETSPKAVGEWLQAFDQITREAAAK